MASSAGRSWGTPIAWSDRPLRQGTGAKLLVKSKATAVWLLGILGISALLRAFTMRQSLWLDELHTAWTVLAGHGELAVRAHLGNNGRLYFVVTNWFTEWLGTSEFSLRLPSLLASLGCVLGTYVVARSWRCPWCVCIGAAGLVAVDRHSLFYAAEARPYAMVQFAALAHLAVSTKLLTTPPSWRWDLAWLLSGVVLYYLHCTTGLFLAGQVVGMAVAVALGLPLTVRLRRLALLFGLLLLACLPSWELIQEIAARRQNWAAFVERQPLMSLFTLYPLSIYVVLPAVAVFASRVLQGVPSEQTGERPSPPTIPLLLTASALATTLGLAWGLTQVDLARLFFIRYLIASSVCLPLLAALLLSYWQGAPKNLALVVTLLVVMLGWRTATVVRTPSWRVNEDWRGAVAFVNDSTAATVPLLLYTGLIETDQRYQSLDPVERDYCAFPVRGLYRLREDRPLVVVPSQQAIRLTTAERAALQTQGGLLMVRGPQRLADLQLRIADVLGEEIQWGEPRFFRKVVLVAFSPRVHVP